jgi:hypothetical protein
MPSHWPQTFSLGASEERKSRRLLVNNLRDKRQEPFWATLHPRLVSGAVRVQRRSNKFASQSLPETNSGTVTEIRELIAPGWQAGDWLLDRNAAWTEPLVEQVTMFPNAAHDDMADMMTQASAWLLRADIPTVTFSIVRL